MTVAQAYTTAGLIHTPGVGWHSPPAPLPRYVPVAREARIGTCPALIDLRRA